MQYVVIHPILSLDTTASVSKGIDFKEWWSVPLLFYISPWPYIHANIARKGREREKSSLQMSCQEKYQVYAQQFCKSSCSVRAVTHKSLCLPPSAFIHYSKLYSMKRNKLIWKSTPNFCWAMNPNIQPVSNSFHRIYINSRSCAWSQLLVKWDQIFCFPLSLYFRKNNMFYWKSVESWKSVSYL